MRQGCLFILALFACATPAAKPRAPSIPVAGLDLTDRALLAGGLDDEVERRGARAELEARITPIAKMLSGIPSREGRARALLSALHSGFLGEYDARATTLGEILDDRRYNCLSSAILYNLVAARAGIIVGGQLLPTHARTLVYLDREGGRVPVVVETTSPQGFDPDAETEAAILGQVASAPKGQARALVDRRGVVVSTEDLIGVVYVNRGTIAQEAGQLELAEQLFGLAEGSVAGGRMRETLRDQRAALLAQLAADDIADGSPEKLTRGYKTARGAVALAPPSSEFRWAAGINLRAAAERLVARAADEGEEGRIDAIIEECKASGLNGTELGGLEAFAGSERARLMMKRGDYDGALGALDGALSRPLSPTEEGLKKTLERNRVAAARAAALGDANRGDAERALSRIDRAIGGEGIDSAQRSELEEDRRRVLALAAQHRFETGDHKGALALYRRGVAAYPGDALLKHNLIATLERVVAPDLDAGRCEVAAPLLAEIQRYDAKSEYPGRGQLRCWILRAEQRMKAGDFAEAAVSLRRARGLPGDDGIVDRNLGAVMVEWAKAHAAAGDCKAARAKLDEAARHNPAAARVRVECSSSERGSAAPIREASGPHSGSSESARSSPPRSVPESSPMPEVVLRLPREALVLVVDFENGVDLDPKAVRAARDLLQSRLEQSGVRTVPDASVRRQIRRAQAETYRAEQDSIRQIELGKALSADHILTTRVSRIDRACRLLSQLRHLKTWEPVASADVEVAACKPDGLELAVSALVQKLIAGLAHR